METPSRHRYESPTVIEITPPREPYEVDDFIPRPAMKYDLGPRLIQHNETQIDYYERQLVQVQKDLARVTLLYSDQLSFDFEQSDEV